MTLEGTAVSAASPADAAARVAGTAGRAVTESGLLQASGLRKVYKGRVVVKEVSISVSAGEIVGLLGPNGAGKTTTFHMIVGLIRPDGGAILLRGQEITGLPVYQRARRGLGYLAQEPSVFRKLTVEQNLMAILETMPLSRQERTARMERLLADLNLTRLGKQMAYTLSGGERRKLEISRALVREPSVLMLDEPFSGVDPLAVNDLQQILIGLRARGLGVFLTDHNVRETLAVVDRAYLIYDGNVLREGSRDYLVNDPVSRELYLGKQFQM
jgi:lipopolysaccharide export system ATP-binding protein